jgi:hypothetical protein
MPSLLVDPAEALERLQSMTDSAVDPVLTSTELTRLLADFKVVSVWVAETEYEYGAVVVPTAAKRNGLIYRLVSFDGVGIESGTTEPTWGTSREARVTDGNLTWEEAGVMPSSLWNLNDAAEAGWILKAGKVVPDVDYGDANHKMSDSQMHKHCMEQARLYRTVKVA